MREAAKAFPEDPESAMVRATVAQAQGRVEESLQLLSRATDTRHHHATGAFYLEGEASDGGGLERGSGRLPQAAGSGAGSRPGAPQAGRVPRGGPPGGRGPRATLDAHPSWPGKPRRRRCERCGDAAASRRSRASRRGCRARAVVKREAAAAALAAGVKDGLPFLAFVPHEPLLAPLRAVLLPSGSHLHGVQVLRQPVHLDDHEAIVRWPFVPEVRLPEGHWCGGGSVPRSR